LALVKILLRYESNRDSLVLPAPALNKPVLFLGDVYKVRIYLFVVGGYSLSLVLRVSISALLIVYKALFVKLL
jgi:hypothetical protein